MVGRGGEDAAAARLANDRLVVEGWIGAEQRQLEAVLTASLAVTAARVTPESTKQRHDLCPEVDGPPAAEAANPHRHARLRRTVTHDYLRGAVAGGPQVAAVIDA